MKDFPTSRGFECIWCFAKAERSMGRRVFEGFCENAPNKMHALPGDVWKLVERYREALNTLGRNCDLGKEGRKVLVAALADEEEDVEKSV